MGIVKKGQNLYQIDAHIRKNGKGCRKRELLDGTKAMAEERYLQLKKELREGLASCSLTIAKTFEDLIEFYLERKGDGSMGAIFGVLKRDLGTVAINRLGQAFDKYLKILKIQPAPNTARQRTPATINRYISCAKMVCNFAVKMSNVTGVLENPLSNFDLAHEEGRDRVLNEDEQVRLIATLERMNSYLYWPVYFSLKNPIRFGDLFNLRRENLDRLKPWIHFYPSKTRKRKPRETCLPFLDDSLLHYFDSILPADCPYLFPNLLNGNWYKVGRIERHWHTVLREAGIQDFHWHDLKHCAITWMIDNGNSDRDLKNLGIQYDSRMIDRYYKHDANKVLDRWKSAKCGHFVDTSKVLQVQKFSC